MMSAASSPPARMIPIGTAQKMLADRITPLTGDETLLLNASLVAECSGCVGVTAWNEYCRSGLTGPFCMVCKSDDEFYVPTPTI